MLFKLVFAKTKYKMDKITEIKFVGQSNVWLNLHFGFADITNRIVNWILPQVSIFDKGIVKSNGLLLKSITYF
jgi:hypothetical protein